MTAAFKGGGEGEGAEPPTLGELLPPIDFWKVNGNMLDVSLNF